MQRRSMVALLAGGAFGAARLAADTPAEIRIRTKKFEFHPDKVTARLGRPVTLILTSQDRIHGFKMPDFGLRADVVPGQETRLTLVPDRPGRFAFLCDVFCGDGHEDMEGTLIVEA
jgi:cytochrome c oxidase subunit II